MEEKMTSSLISGGYAPTIQEFLNSTPHLSRQERLEVFNHVRKGAMQYPDYHMRSWDKLLRLLHMKDKI